MKYLKLLDDWSDRWTFLESAPPRVFVLASADWEHIMYKGENDQSIVNGGITYNFIHCAQTIYEQEAKVYFDRPLPQDINLNIQWTVRTDTGYMMISKSSSYCAKNSTSITFSAPTTLQNNGVQYNVSDIVSFSITGHSAEWVGSATIITV
jgi:hypothetical protein